MSADSDIATLLSHATLAASSLANSADTLVNEAVAALEEVVEFPDPPVSPKETGISYDGDFELTDPPVGFPAWPAVEFEDVPVTQKQNKVRISVPDTEFPVLSFPSFNYPNIAGVPTFNVTTPDAGAEQSLPAIPNTDFTFVPNFLAMSTVDSVNLAVPAPTFAPINTAVAFDSGVFDAAFARFKSAIFGGVGNIPGLDNLLVELRRWTQTTLDAVLPAALEIISARLSAKQSAVLVFQNDIRNRMTARLTEARTNTAALLVDHSGWELPQAVQLARQASIAQLASAWEVDAGNAVDAQTAELALGFFEACGELLAGFVTAMQKLKADEINLVLEAHQQALVYAKASIAALLAQYEAENFTKQDINYQQAEAQLKLFEAELSVALLTYKVARANLQVEESKQDNDAAAIQTYQSQQAHAQNQVNLYASLVTAARGEVRFKQFAMERFVLLVKAYNARIDAWEAQINAKIANIDGDEAKVRGQLKKVEGYEAQVRGFLQLLKTKQAIIEAESTRNEAVIDEFKLRVDAAITALEKDALDNAYALKKYEVIAEDALAGAKLVLREAQSELQFQAKKQEGQLDAYELTQERNVELMKTALERLRAIAEVNAQGANIMASMAQGAMSAANGIAAAIFSETE